MHRPRLLQRLRAEAAALFKGKDFELLYDDQLVPADPLGPLADEQVLAEAADLATMKQVRVAKTAALEIEKLRGAEFALWDEPNSPDCGPCAGYRAPEVEKAPGALAALCQTVALGQPPRGETNVSVLLLLLR